MDREQGFVWRCGKMKNWQFFLILSAIYSMPHLYDGVSKMLALGSFVLATIAAIRGN